ncbi:MAG TPA: helix-turn-helix domain-containing protein [Candidatus Saccharimonadales bacterium]|nr:helix-turn-helix domain-containing protein [Candidatus Saccharimonadales bacterium]
MSHLTAADRGRLEVLLQEKYTNKQIGEKLGKHGSTIGRAIASGLDGSGCYSAFVGQVAYNTNRKRSRQIPKARSSGQS